MAISKIILNGVIQMDLTQDTVTPSTVLSGETATGADGVRFTGTYSGGRTEAIDNDVTFIDYDGTILYSYSATEFASLNSLPSNPSHSGLTAQGWNWTLSDAKAYVAKYGSLCIGQSYITDDGKTRLYLEVYDLCQTIYLNGAIQGSVEVDWGDGSSVETLTGYGTATPNSYSHVYSSPGYYEISIDVPENNIFAFFTYSTKPIIHGDYASASANYAYGYGLKHVRLGNNIQLSMYAFADTGLRDITIPTTVSFSVDGVYVFWYCYDLTGIVLPNSCSVIKENYFYYNNSLRKISIPKTVNTISNYAFNQCSTLNQITIPEGVTSIRDYCFQYCTNLRTVVIPDTATEIRYYAFNQVMNMVTLTIPDSVLTIQQAFSTLAGLKELHFKSTTPPTISSASTFSSLSTSCIIYVPTGSLSDYTSETNYPSSATYTYVEE